MKIKHRPIFNTSNVLEFYTKKDKVPITYVCTSALNFGTLPVDVFYRATPHPEFGNRYFGLYSNIYANGASIMITNADCIETLEFTMVKPSNKNKWVYSQHRHDYYSYGNIAIDGGRAYSKLVGDINLCKIKDMKVIDGSFRRNNICK